MLQKQTRTRLCVCVSPRLLPHDLCFCAPRICVVLYVLTLYSSVSQGVGVPISASGLIGLQPLWRMTHVGKGSRQIRSVPLEEGLALRVVLRVCVGSVFLLDQASGASLRIPASVLRGSVRSS